MEAKGRSVSREWPAVMIAAQRSGRLRTFNLKTAIRFGDEGLW